MSSFPSILMQALPDRLLPWFRENARDLPWRADREPYHVWLSEIMLQQTRVEAVRGYYARFLQALPTVQALAEADPDRLNKLWEGLGYYSRVRNLQKAARMLTEEYGGSFPETRAQLLKLPGIGPYTAGAISSICFGQPEPAVDGNVLRVVSRFTGSDAPIDRPETRTEMEEALRAVYPAGQAGSFTQSLMELGAVVCLPNGAPACDACPLRDLCRARLEDKVGLLPVKAGKKPRRIEQLTVFLLQCDDRIAVRRRPDHGLLAGLWEYPNVPGSLDAGQAAAQAEAWGVRPQEVLRRSEKKHIFTHVEWHMTVWQLRCAAVPETFFWADRQQLQSQVALPTAFRICREEETL